MSFWLLKPFCQPPDSNKRMDNASIRKGLDAITTSLNHLGDTFEKAYEVPIYLWMSLSEFHMFDSGHRWISLVLLWFPQDGKTMVESKTADLRSQIRRKGDGTNQASSIRNPWQQSDQTQSHSPRESQLKASRDVRCQLCNHV